MQWGGAIMSIAERNGLRLFIGEITSKTNTGSKEGVHITDWEGLWGLIREYLSKDAYLLAYLNYKVLVGRLQDKQPEFYAGETFDPKYLLQLRVFSEEEEFTLWKRSEALFSSRFRTDREGERCEVVEAAQLVWGDVKAIEPDWVRVKDNGRGMELVIPWTGPVNKGDRIKIRTRNYVGYSNMGQAGYIDCRLVDFLSCRGGM
jgi:CRISPR-associated protein (TIGR03984 family)